MDTQDSRMWKVGLVKVTAEQGRNVVRFSRLPTAALFPLAPADNAAALGPDDARELASALYDAADYAVPAQPECVAAAPLADGYAECTGIVAERIAEPQRVDVHVHVHHD